MMMKTYLLAEIINAYKKNLIINHISNSERIIFHVPLTTKPEKIEKLIDYLNNKYEDSVESVKYYEATGIFVIIYKK